MWHIIAHPKPATLPCWDTKVSNQSLAAEKVSGSGSKPMNLHWRLKAATPVEPTPMQQSNTKSLSLLYLQMNSCSNERDFCSTLIGFPLDPRIHSEVSVTEAVRAMKPWSSALVRKVLTYSRVVNNVEVLLLTLRLVRVEGEASGHLGHQQPIDGDRFWCPQCPLRKGSSL